MLEILSSSSFITSINRQDWFSLFITCTFLHRLFFRSCGFRDDMLGSTTMTYTRSASNNEQMVSAGRKLLLIPTPSKLKK